MKIILLFLSFCVFASEPTPKQSVISGCPCLDCPYFQAGQKNGVWMARQDVPLVASPKTPQTVTATLKAGERAVALSGELHILPGELEVTFPHKNYKVGDVVFITHEDADAGAWKLWFKGAEDFDDLSRMVSEKQPCKVPSEQCWAKVKKNLSTVWWVNLQTKDKKTAWTKAIPQFEFDRSSCM